MNKYPYTYRSAKSYYAFADWILNVIGKIKIIDDTKDIDDPARIMHPVLPFKSLYKEWWEQESKRKAVEDK